MIRHYVSELKTYNQRLDALETILNQTKVSLHYPTARLNVDHASTMINVSVGHWRPRVMSYDRVLVTLTRSSVTVEHHSVENDFWPSNRHVNVDKFSDGKHPQAEWLSMIIVGV